MTGAFSPPPRVSDPDMHHGTCMTHVPWWMPVSLTNGFLRSRWRGKRSLHSRRMRNPQFYVSGKRPIQCHSKLLGISLWELSHRVEMGHKCSIKVGQQWFTLLIATCSEPSDYPSQCYFMVNWDKIQCNLKWGQCVKYRHNTSMSWKNEQSKLICCT